MESREIDEDSHRFRILKNALFSEDNVNNLVEYINRQVNFDPSSKSSCKKIVIAHLDKYFKRIQRNPRDDGEIKKFHHTINSKTIENIMTYLRKEYPHLNKKPNPNKLRRDADVYGERENHLFERPYINSKKTVGEREDDTINMQVNNMGIEGIREDMNDISKYASPYGNTNISIPLINNKFNDNGQSNKDAISSRLEQMVNERNYENKKFRPPDIDFSDDGSGSRRKNNNQMGQQGQMGMMGAIDPNMLNSYLMNNAGDVMNGSFGSYDPMMGNYGGMGMGMGMGGNMGMGMGGNMGMGMGGNMGMGMGGNNAPQSEKSLDIQKKLESLQMERNRLDVEIDPRKAQQMQSQQQQQFSQQYQPFQGQQFQGQSFQGQSFQGQPFQGQPFQSFQGQQFQPFQNQGQGQFQPFQGQGQGQIPQQLQLGSSQYGHQGFINNGSTINYDHIVTTNKGDKIEILPLYDASPLTIYDEVDLKISPNPTPNPPPLSNSVKPDPNNIEKVKIDETNHVDNINSLKFKSLQEIENELKDLLHIKQEKINNNESDEEIMKLDKRKSELMTNLLKLKKHFYNEHQKASEKMNQEIITLKIDPDKIDDINTDICYKLKNSRPVKEIKLLAYNLPLNPHNVTNGNNKFYFAMLGKTQGITIEMGTYSVEDIFNIIQQRFSVLKFSLENELVTIESLTKVNFNLIINSDSILTSLGFTGKKNMFKDKNKYIANDHNILDVHSSDKIKFMLMGCNMDFIDLKADSDEMCDITIKKYIRPTIIKDITMRFFTSLDQYYHFLKPFNIKFAIIFDD